MFKSGAVRITRIQNQDDGEVHVHEQQSAAVKRVQKQGKKHHIGSDVKITQAPLDRFLEYWLGVVFNGLKSLRVICTDLIPTMSHADWEVSSGMEVMQRIVVSCVDRLTPYVLKYRAKGDFGHQVSDDLKDKLFPSTVIGGFSGSESYDTLVALEGFYTFLCQISARLITLSPSANALWDEGFVSAVNFTQTQIERIKAWTKQQLQSRGPQALLVPCIAAAELKKKLEQEDFPVGDAADNISEGE
jgi:ferredoxin-nitrate reductase